MHETFADRLALIERNRDFFDLIELAIELEQIAAHRGPLPLKVELIETVAGRVGECVELPESIQRRVAEVVVMVMCGLAAEHQIQQQLREIATCYRALLASGQR